MEPVKAHRTPAWLGWSAALGAVVATSPARADTDYFSPPSVRGFADYLFRNGDYRRAAGEYQRYLFLVGATGNEDSIRYRIGVCYAREGDVVAARQQLGLLLTDTTRGLREDAALEMSHLLLEAGDYRGSRALFEPDNPFALRYRPCLTNAHVVTLLLMRDWCGAESHAAGALACGPGCADSGTAELLRLASLGARLPRRYPLAAACMSAAIPGAGKLYSGRSADAVVSFLLVGLSGAQAVWGFHRDGISSVRGWVYGIVSMGFYAGNVYGAVTAARLHNRRAESVLLEKAEAVAGISPS